MTAEEGEEDNKWYTVDYKDYHYNKNIRNQSQYRILPKILLGVHSFSTTETNLNIYGHLSFECFS